MRRFRRSTALRPISPGELRNADLFFADLHGSAVQSESLSLSNHVLSFEELLFGAARSPQVLPAVPEHRPAVESLPDAWPVAPPTAFPAGEREKAPARSPVLLPAISAKLRMLDRHLSRRNKRAAGRESWSGEDFVPTSLPGVGADFDILISSLFDLETAAIKNGYGFDQRLSAFRKVFYDSGGWDLIIPGAASVQLPASWRGGALAPALRDVRALETLDIQGKPTAISHLFAGLDAGNHLVKPLHLRFWKFPVARISSGKAQATYAGDLGSVCYEYQKARGKVPFAKAAKNLDSAVMKKVFSRYASDADMGGNADAFALALDKSVTVVQNLFDYYTAPPPGAGIHLRWYHLMRAIVGGRSGSAVSTELKDDVFSAAEAYAVGLKNDKLYVLNLETKPGPGIAVPTFWDFAMNSAVWTIDEFLDRAHLELDALQKSLGPTP